MGPGETAAKKRVIGLDSRFLAWALCAVALALISGTVVLAVLNARDLDNVTFSIVGISGAVVGGVVASKRPDNIVGWLFLGGALASSLRGLTLEYAVYGAATEPGALPFPGAAAWFSEAVSFVGPVLTFVLIPLYFPTGRPVSRRWGLVAWISLGMLLVGTFLTAVSPGEILPGTGIGNPLGVDAARGVGDALQPFLFASYMALIFAAAASLVVRYLRSGGVERQQIKWFTFAAAFIPVWFVTNRPIETAFPVLFDLMDALVIAAVPVAAGIAILRYRLYDIDVIINRALVYAILSASLVGVYLGGVVSLQFVLRSVTGENSQIAVVASTLVIAALFNPLRRLIQGFIDRRFYRQKYDAARTLEAFSAHLRDETDLGRLDAELLAAVHKTLRPEHASLWLREPENR